MCRKQLLSQDRSCFFISYILISLSLFEVKSRVEPFLIAARLRVVALLIAMRVCRSPKRIIILITFEKIDQLIAQNICIILYPVAKLCQIFDVNGFAILAFSQSDAFVDNTCPMKWQCLIYGIKGEGRS